MASSASTLDHLGEQVTTVDGDEYAATITTRRYAPPLYRRIRNGGFFANASRYDLPADFADQVRRAVEPCGVRLDVITDEPRAFIADIVGSESSLNQATAAVIDLMDPDGTSRSR